MTIWQIWICIHPCLLKIFSLRTMLTLGLMTRNIFYTIFCVSNAAHMVKTWNNKVTNIEDNQYRGYVLNVCRLNVVHFIQYIVYLNEFHIYTQKCICRWRRHRFGHGPSQTIYCVLLNNTHKVNAWNSHSSNIVGNNDTMCGYFPNRYSRSDLSTLSLQISVWLKLSSRQRRGEKW